MMNLHRAARPLLRAWHLLSAASLLAGLALGTTPVRVAQAATITVTTFVDGFNDIDGFCSLREAIRAANTDATVDACTAGSAVGRDLISIPAGTYNLTRAGAADNSNVLGDLDIIGAVDLVVTGGTAVIDASAIAERVLHLQPAASVTLENITIQGGAVTGGNGGGILVQTATLTMTNVTVTGNSSDTNGGGVMVQTASTLAVISSTVSSNTAASGGGIFSDGTLSLDNSRVLTNTATANSGGGGIRNNAGATTLTNGSAVNGNTASGATSAGGGILVNTGSLSVSNSTIGALGAGNSSGSTGGGGLSLNAGTVVTLTASSVISNSTTGNGAGILNQGTLTLDNVSVTHNTASSSGGGLRVQNAAASVTILNGSVFSDNATGAGNSGGGISVSNGSVSITGSTLGPNNSAGTTDGGGLALGTSTVVTVTNSSIISNTTTGSGGGIANRGGTLTVSGSTLSGNFASGDAGALRNALVTTPGSTTISTSSLTANSADNGGAVQNTGGTVTIVDTAIYSNTATAGGGGGLDNNTNTGTTTLNIFNSAVYSNTASANGGGIANSGGATSASVVISNTTISGNSSGSGSSGGGIRNNDSDASVSLLNATIVNNTAPGSGAGGGIRNITGTVTLTNTIIANNTAATGSNCNTSGGGTLTSGGHNLENVDTCSLAGTGDLPNTSASLGPLQDNGGPTPTRALLVGSPAVDAGDNAACPATDQRGFARPFNGTCDIGAYELTTADLNISKTNDLASVIAGTEVVYTVVVTNTGSITVADAVVTDTFPAALTNPSWTCEASAGSSCAASGSGSLNEAVTLAAGGLVTFTITSTVASSATGILTNTAAVTLPTGTVDPTLPNTATDADSITTEADLALGKAGSPDPVTAGQALTYTLAITNAGPSDAANVTVTDTLPAGVSLVSAPGCTGTTGLTCGLGTLAAGASTVVTVEVTVSAAVTSTLTNLAGVTSDTPDPSAADNTASLTTTVDSLADVSVTVSDSPDPVTAGTSLTYTLTISNAGPSDAQGVVVTASLPADVSLASAPGCTGTTDLSCSLGTLAAGASTPVVVQVTVDSGFAGPLNLTAGVSASTADPSSANNTDAESTTAVLPNPVPALTSLSPVSATAGGPSFTLTLTGTNFVAGSVVRWNGSDRATGFVSSTRLTATVLAGDIAAAGTASVTVFNPAPGGGLSNALTFTITQVATDLSITKTASPDPVTAGKVVTYTIQVFNNGSAVTGAALTDTFPAQISNVTWSCSASAGSSCGSPSGSGNIAALALNLLDGGTATITASGTVALTASGTVSNTATVAAPANVTDTNPGNNSATRAITVNPIFFIFLPLILR